MDIIKLAIKCADCSNVLVKPVILPCGSSVCQKHVNDLNKGEYFCKQCNNDHHIDANNMVVSNSLQVLINANLEKFNFGPNFKAALTYCNKLDQTIHTLETIRSEPGLFIKQTIDRLKYRTELIREVAKLQIDENASKIFKQLDNYEKECMINLNSPDLETKLNEIDKNINKLKHDLLEWQKKLNDFSLDEIQLKTIKKASNESNIRLTDALVNFKNDLLVGKLDDHYMTVFNFQNNKPASDIKLDKELIELNDTLKSIDFSNSRIIDKQKKQDLSRLCAFSSEDKWTLIYKANQYNFSAEDFHLKCDDVSNTLTIVKSMSGCLFGGYTSRAWNQSDTYKSDPKAFLFSFINPENKSKNLNFWDVRLGYINSKSEILKIKNSSTAIYCKADYGPTFGIGHDLCILKGSKSYSRLGSTYPERSCDGYNYSHLTESENFTFSDIEIYKII